MTYEEKCLQSRAATDACIEREADIAREWCRRCDGFGVWSAIPRETFVRAQQLYAGIEAEREYEGALTYYLRNRHNPDKLAWATRLLGIAEAGLGRYPVVLGTFIECYHDDAQDAAWAASLGM